ncbi:hypothetical protein [uncultured Roseobacter sp.]|uniref:hypothetical protein n=1 Tax=uncultured Roseobacter sp. TaxID=114847 RepID=UPI00260EC1F6|nr:hypothetical protein [uncultured Roseobacter sp.]
MKNAKSYFSVFLISTIFVIVPFLLWGEDIENWVELELLNRPLFMVAFIGSVLLIVDIFLPIPSSAVGILLGATLGISVALPLVAVSLTLGVVVGYWAGVYVPQLLLKTEETEKQPAPVDLVSLAIFRPVPVLAEVSVVMAGFRRVPFLQVIAVTSIANVGLAALYVLIGVALPFSVAATMAFILMVLAVFYAVRKPSQHS